MFKYEICISYGYWEKLYFNFDSIIEADAFLKNLWTHLVSPEKVSISFQLVKEDPKEEEPDKESEKEAKTDE